jgi:hypothetical protein
MTKQDDRDALLVVVAAKSQAVAIETALSTRGIAARIDQDVNKLIEFAGKLGSNPCGVYVRRVDLARAKEVLVAKGLPDSAGELGVRSALGM